MGNQKNIDIKKNVFSRMGHLRLSAAKKISVGYSYLLCVFVSLLMIISIRRNKQRGHTTSQSDFTIGNVRRCSFFRFHTLSRASFDVSVWEPKKMCFCEWDTCV